MLFKTSTVFAENLEQFPAIDSVERIEFYQDGKLLSSVDNAEGQKGSLALYFYHSQYSFQFSQFLSFTLAVIIHPVRNPSSQE